MNPLHHLENPCNRLGTGGRVDGPRPEAVAVVRPRRVVRLPADELGDGGRRLFAGGAAAAVVLVVVFDAAAGRAEEGGGGVLGAEEVYSVVRHAAGAVGLGPVTGQRPPLLRPARGALGAPARGRIVAWAA